MQCTSRGGETSAQVSGRLGEELRLLRKLHGKLCTIFSQQWFRGAVAAGIISVLILFLYCSGLSIHQLSFVSGDEGQRGLRVARGELHCQAGSA